MFQNTAKAKKQGTDQIRVRDWSNKSTFVRIIHPVTVLLAFGFCFLVSARVLAEDESPTELMRRIAELYEQGKYREAIPLAEKLVALMKKLRGPEDPQTA